MLISLVIFGGLIAAEGAPATFKLEEIHPAFRPSEMPAKPRFVFGRPIVSFLLPGFDQWMDGQYAYAATYSTLGIGGFALASTGKVEDYGDFNHKDWSTRRSLIGTGLYVGAGGMSSYQSFRTAVTTHYAAGNYQFLRESKTETPLELALSPFRFDYLMRLTTLFPLAVVGGLASYIWKSDNQGWTGLEGGDYASIGAVGYGPGVGEEPAFRGFVLPAFYENMGHRFWLANVSQGLVFASLHISGDNPVPWPQFLLGSYLGWLTQYRGWTISENIFIHAWWNIIVMTAELATTQQVNQIAISPFKIKF